jgi:hypothetical protein
VSDLPGNLADAFEYLDDLRESGITNMYGARPYVARHMGYDGDTAGSVLSAWMETFDPEVSPADRAAKLVAASAS